MNILELCLTGELGGLELYVFRVASALSDKHTVRVVTRGRLLEHFQKNSTLKPEQANCFFRPLPLIAAYKLARYIDTHDVDIIHVHWTKDLPLAALAKMMGRKKPALVFTRQMDITRSKNDPYHNMQYEQVDLFITITQKLAASCKKYIGKSFKGRIEPLYHGVPEPEHFLTATEINQRRRALGINDGAFVVGLLGRLERNKGQHLLIEAVAKAKEKGIRLTALIVGHEMVPGYRKTLEDLARKLTIIDQVVFNDFVNDPQLMMQICDCVTLTTYNETFGLVLPEAMRAGVAVVGSNKGGVTEIIEHESSGLLFESGNSASLCEQLLRLYQHPELRTALAKQGQARADDIFNDKLHIENLEKILEAVTT